ncbi:MAG: TonB-dependent receptor [Bacteroidetes bacterium]|nr:TonB-dependent receptor [Bacteroidota bacterium]
MRTYATILLVLLYTTTQAQDTTHAKLLDSAQVRGTTHGFGITRLKDVDGAGIYAGKKSEVVIIKDLNANTATNNSRQLYSKVAGLNIYENDGGAGIQLAIGGRGLDPNRVSNFNTRQNGYDISADALGYPESYYTPSADMIERIEIVRGASSLQYGTQFGGIINFRLNHGSDTAKYQLLERLSTGSWGFLNTTTSIGGTIKNLNYYAFFQHKSGDGWRPNSRFNVNTGYTSETWHASEKLSITVQYTHEDYLEKQPGGLTDAMFEADPRQATKSRNWFKVNWNLGALLLDYAISSKLQLNSRFFGLSANRDALGIINTVNDPGGPRQYRTDQFTNWGNETRLLYTYNTKTDHPSVLLGGVRYYHGNTDRQIGNSNDGATGTSSDFQFTKSTLFDSLSYSRYKFPNHNLAFFAENIFRITPKLSLIPGIRFENISTRSDGFYNAFTINQVRVILNNKLVEEHRLSNRNFFIGGLGLSYVASSDVQWYANFSQNYRGINFNDMSIVNPNYHIDPNLQDEKGYSVDLGVRGRHSDILNYDVSVFMINYNNRIGKILQQDTTSPNIYRLTTNVAQSRNWGVESFAELDVWKLIAGSGAHTRLSIFSNLSWIDSRYVHSKEPAYSNKKVEFVPDIIWRSGISFRKGRLSATAQYSYTGKQFTDATNSTTPTNNGINGLIPAYYVMDFTADFRLSRTISLSGTINNLSDNHYFTRRADSYPGPGIIPADGRAGYITLQVKL